MKVGAAFGGNFSGSCLYLFRTGWNDRRKNWHQPLHRNWVGGSSGALQQEFDFDHRVCKAIA